MEPYIETASGKMFPLLDPKPTDINIRDIATALSKICRFTGHTEKFYSVAEHSWHCANVLMDQPKEVQLAALLHDASEAYCQDISSPLKALLPEYKEIEDRIAGAIFKKYGLEYPFSALIKFADLTMLNTEAYYLMHSKGNTWKMWETVKRPAVQHDRRPLGLPPEVAKEVFLTKFAELRGLLSDTVGPD